MEILSEQKPRHKWSDGHRHLLCLFSKLYGNSIEDMTNIMNHILAKELRAEGFQSGMPSSTVRWQLLNIQQGASGYDIWRKVILDPTIAEARKTFREGRDAIEDAALSLGITLHLQTEEVDRIRPHGKRLGKRARKIQELRGVLGDLISSDDESDSDLPGSGNRQRMSASVETPIVTRTRHGQGQLLTPISRQSGGNTPGSFGKISSGRDPVPEANNASKNAGEPRSACKSLPKLVFRWYNDQSQGLNTPAELRAGKFLDQSQTITPPVWTMEAVTNHLVPHKLLSPFISFRESLRPCIFRALKAGMDTNACVTLVNLEKVRDMSIQKWGSENAVKACPNLIKHFGLTLGRGGSYKGGGEWLVHGEVPREAIVATFTITEFVYYEQRIPNLAKLLQLDVVRAARTAYMLIFNLMMAPGDMTWHSGIAVGTLMKNLDIPGDYWREFGVTFAESWQLRGYDARKSGKSYQEYLSGILHAKDNPDRLLDIEDAASGDKDDRIVSGARNIIMGGQYAHSHTTSPEQEQYLIDAQLHAELASFLWEDSPPPTSSRENERRDTAGGSSIRTGTTPSKPGPRKCAAPARFARPRSSSLFTFSRPMIAGSATDWEARNSRDVSPTATETSALDTFTTELLAKAEECSTIGSFGRRSTTARLPSEAQIPREETGRNQERKVPETVLDENPVIDLSSDDDDDDSVEDLGIEIVGSRRIGK